MGKVFNVAVEKISEWMQVVAGVVLLLIMFLTTADVCLRNLIKSPIIGTFELVALGGAIITGFAIPITSFLRGHIFVDFMVNSFPTWAKNTTNIITRLLNIALFLLIAWNLYKYGLELQQSGEVTLTRQLPFYPVAYGLGVCCIILCFVFLVDIKKIIGGEYE